VRRRYCCRLSARGRVVLAHPRIMPVLSRAVAARGSLLSLSINLDTSKNPCSMIVTVCRLTVHSMFEAATEDERDRDPLYFLSPPLPSSRLPLMLLFLSRCFAAPPSVDARQTVSAPPPYNRARTPCLVPSNPRVKARPLSRRSFNGTLPTSSQADSLLISWSGFYNHVSKSTMPSLDSGEHRSS
jgi:hypothetical protein